MKKSFEEVYRAVEFNSAYFEMAHPLIHDWFNPKPTVQPPSSGVISNLYVFANGIILLLLCIIPMLNNNYLSVNL